MLLYRRAVVELCCYSGMAVVELCSYIDGQWLSYAATHGQWFSYAAIHTGSG